ncbi:exopolyphosphatase/guanosine-5'-triphosphate,3'-diphosphate pyrophosphatase [Brevundimonas alba]|uniref:Exopolyphosphatase/guanosine-5'-triphosphate, 3'-diphosphate pyrophosphatase n=1 Tax=Brevundimonas alba TaxID=74314 RepID=A0A7X6BNT0_9CAUL|nr:Ppx/GppA phosphatase family protein [Brevundimonas alba]NJC42503.1 exopolyphosphatase/guanosine-5'-triphosphate,3'-diphosphate pyrophosphatase [Brevundimonas alba]
MPEPLVSVLGAPREFAAIDIGSNSVRLVLYRLEGRAVWTVFNEKVLAGLGRDLATTGRLSEDGAALALTALKRFAAVLDGVKPARTFVAATAAIREADDGQAFCERVAAETGLIIRVLSGEEEARYAALGVIAGMPTARGVAADLGGASLELVRIGEGGVERGITLPLGPFSLASDGAFDAGKLRETIAKRLKPAADFSTDTLYAVGGAWRTLAQVHMGVARYPLQIVHQYVMSAADAKDIARLIARSSKASLESWKGLSKKRAETLPHAALVLEGLIERLGLERIVLSAWGVREGLLYEALDEETVAADPLLAGCTALGARQGISPGLPGALFGWIQPISTALPSSFGAERDLTLADAACRLADLGARLHPDHRIELAFDQVLRAPIPGQTHAERAWLATAVNARYGGAAATPEPDTVARLLTEEQRTAARALGLAIRLACDLSGRSPQLLVNAHVAVKDGALVLSASDGYADVLLGEQTRRRGKALAEAMGLKLDLRSGG